MNDNSALLSSLLDVPFGLLSGGVGEPHAVQFFPPSAKPALKVLGDLMSPVLRVPQHLGWGGTLQLSWSANERAVCRPLGGLDPTTAQCLTQHNPPIHDCVVHCFPPPIPNRPG